MKVVIAYESKYGNGRKCVELLRELIESKGHEAGSYPMNSVKPSDLPQADLYVFSSPTHVGKPPRAVRGYLKKFQPPREGSKYALMATFLRTEDKKEEETKEPEKLQKTISIMDEILGQKGMRKVAEQPIFVRGMKGPLEDGYEAKIEDFADRILAAVD